MLFTEEFCYILCKYCLVGEYAMSYYVILIVVHVIELLIRSCCLTFHLDYTDFIVCRSALKYEFFSNVS